MKKTEELTDKEKQRIYRENNREKLRLIQRRYYKKHRKEILAKKKKDSQTKEEKEASQIRRHAYYLKNREKQMQKQKESRAIDKAKKQKLEFYEELMRMNKFVPTPAVKESRLKKFFNRIFRRK